MQQNDKMTYLKKYLPLILILILSFFSFRALLNPGFFMMHDSQQVARLFEMDKALRAGQFPVRWVEDLGFGYGYPLFNFYPPFVYYLGEIAHLVGVSFIDSIKIVWFLALVGSGLAMYFLSREFWGKTGAVISALFYIYAPYHAIDAYVRGALAELFSFVWLPLILLMAYKGIKENKAFYFVWSGIFLGLLMITHNLIFLPFVIIYTCWFVLIYSIFGQKNWLKFIVSFLLPIIVSFCLTAFFWLPSLSEKQFTLVDDLLTKSLASYKIHFVCLSQLWDSPWGFGGSIPGCVDGLSFKIGKLHLFLTSIAIVVGLITFKKLPKISSLIFGTILIFAFSAFMTTDYSRFIWDNISQLWYLQFPWRFLEFVSLLTAFLAGSIVLIIKNKKVKLCTTSVVVIILIFLSAKLFVPQTYLDTISDKQLTSDEAIKWDVSSSSFEYLPRGIATKYTAQNVLWVDINKEQIATRKYIVLSGKPAFLKEFFASDRFELSGRSELASIIQFQITNFPGWKVYINGKEAIISDSNKYKLLTINVSKGDFNIVARFTNTPVRSLGNLLTISSIVVLLLFFYVNRRIKA